MKTRFAPSPTGFLHVGGLRTALFAYLLAKKEGGVFALRVEDTDRTRLVDGATEYIVDALAWAGISIDEGVLRDGDVLTQKGEAGPYIQSERKEAGIYQKYIEQLLEAGHAYYAFDTSEELDAMRERQQTLKQPTRYDRDNMTNQFTLPEAEWKERVAQGDFVIRLNMPKSGKTQWTDLVRGSVEFQNELIDDQILLKADGYPTYHFAVVVDDHEMGITHVVRGEEWVSSTPKHLALYAAFGWEAPQFAHLSLLVNEQKQKLSKRHGDVSVQDFKEKGYLPEALVNFIAFLGWNPGDEREIFSLAELEEAFSIEKVGKAAAVFNYVKLDWFNKQYMMHMPADELARRALPFFKNNGLLAGVSDAEAIEQLTPIVPLEQGRAATLLELAEALAFLFSEEIVYDADLLIWRKGTKEEAHDRLENLKEYFGEWTGDWSASALEEHVLPWIKENGWGNGDVLWPLRVALSGKKNSPGPFELAGVLGREKTLERIDEAIEKLSE